ADLWRSVSNSPNRPIPIRRRLTFPRYNLYKFRGPMALKTKAKSKAGKKVVRRTATQAKSVRLKGKTQKSALKSASSRKSKKPVRGDSRGNSAVAAAASTSRASIPERQRSRQFASAVHAYEAGIKLMHAEDFVKAIKCFEALIAEHPEEPEIQERAKVH